MKRVFIILFVLFLASPVFAGRAVLQDGTGAETGTTTNPLKVQISGNLQIADDACVDFGDGDDAKQCWETTGNDSLQLGLDLGAATASGYFSIMEKADLGNANRSPSGTTANSTLRIYSADATVAADYIDIYHNQTNAVLDVGAGSLTILDGTAFTPGADQTLAAGTQIAASATLVRVVGNGGAVTLTGTPTIVETGVADGQIIILQGTSDANTVTLQDESALADTDLQLSGGVNFTLGVGDTITLIYDSGDVKFYELSRSDN